MEKNKVLKVIRIIIAVAVWLIITKLYGAFLDPLWEGRIPVIIRMILSSMVVPYTLGLGAFYIIVRGMPEACKKDSKTMNLFKCFIIQTGISFPCLMFVNFIVKILGIETPGITSEELFGHLWFYIILLLIFNPVMEELLFRKFVLERLGFLGIKGTIICSAVLFALPHLISQGPAQVLYTFALGLVWAYVTLKTGKLWPAIILHSLSNIYCAYIPMAASNISPLASVAYAGFTMLIIMPVAIVLLVKEFKL